MRLFYFIARYISYTFAVALFISIVGFFEGFYLYLIASSFILTSYEKIFRIFLQWLPVIFSITMFLYFVFSGMFTPIRIPSLMSRHRRINRVFKAEFKTDDSQKELYGDFSDLVMNNTTASAFITVAIAL